MIDTLLDHSREGRAGFQTGAACEQRCSRPYSNNWDSHARIPAWNLTEHLRP